MELNCRCLLQNYNINYTADVNGICAVFLPQQQCLSVMCLSAMASLGPEMALCATYPTVSKMTLIGISIQGVNVEWRRREVGGEGQFRPSVSSQTAWHGVQLCCGGDFFF